jgi:hypothetical protein
VNQAAHIDASIRKHAPRWPEPHIRLTKCRFDLVFLGDIAGASYRLATQRLDRCRGLFGGTSYYVQNRDAVAALCAQHCDGPPDPASAASNDNGFQLNCPTPSVDIDLSSPSLSS